MQRVLVVGGSGYIGSQTVYSLLDAGYTPIVLDVLRSPFLPQDLEYVLVDIRDKEGLGAALYNLDFESVIHFAANPANNHDIPDNQEMYYRNNFLGTLNLAEVLQTKGVKNLVFSSTAAVYGLPESLPISESQSKLPLNMYGQTKYMAELMWQDFCRIFGMRVTCLRYFNASGADIRLRTGENHSPETHLIPIVLEVAAGKRDKLYIFGNDYDTPDGTCVRDYIHVADLAAAHIKSLAHMESQDLGYFEALNLGTGEGYSNLQIIETVREITGREVAFEFASRRVGDWDSAYADNSRAVDILHWKPLYSSLNNIVKTAWDWYQKIHH